MEGDSTSELEALLLLDFDFDHEVDNLFSQADPSNQQNPSLGNLSHVLKEVDLELYEETGSASGSNLPLSISSRSLTGTINITTSTGQLNPSPEIASNITLPRSPSLDRIIGMPPQAYNPTTEINWEQQPLLGENNHAQLEWTNSNPSLPEITVPNNFSWSVASSFNTPFSEAHEPYFQATVETIQEINTVSLNQLNVRPGNGHQNELLLPQPMTAPINQSNSLPVDKKLSQNVGNIYFHNNTNQQALPYPASFRINSRGLGITNGRSEIKQPPPSCLPNYQNFPYNITPLTPSRPQINQRLGPNVQCSNSVLPSSLVPLRPQSVQYQRNQFPLLPTFQTSHGHPLMHASSRNPLYQAGMTSNNHIMPSDSHMLLPRAQVYQAGLSSNNPIIPSPLLVPRDQVLSNHGTINQAFAIMPYMSNPQPNNSLLLDPSTATWPQSALHQLNRVPLPPTFQNSHGGRLMQAPSRPSLYQARVTPNNAIIPSDGLMLVPRPTLYQGVTENKPIMPSDGPMLAPRPHTVLHRPSQVPMPPTFQNSHSRPLILAPSRPPLYQAGQVTPNNPIMPSEFSVLVPRHQELPNHGPINQAIPMMPNMINPQLNNALLLDPSIAARGQELPNHGPIIQAFPLMRNMINPQLNNSLLSNPSMSTRLRATYSSPDCSQLRLNLNSSTQQQAFAGRLNRGLRRRYEDGESSSTTKRARWDFTGQGRGPQSLVSQSQEHGGDNPFKSLRPIQNVLYDPLYESIGLPIDPHLRCIARKN